MTDPLCPHVTGPSAQPILVPCPPDGLSIVRAFTSAQRLHLSQKGRDPINSHRSAQSALSDTYKLGGRDVVAALKLTTVALLVSLVSPESALGLDRCNTSLSLSLSLSL